MPSSSLHQTRSHIFILAYAPSPQPETFKGRVHPYMNLQAKFYQLRKELLFKSICILKVYVVSECKEDFDECTRSKFFMIKSIAMDENWREEDLIKIEWKVESIFAPKYNLSRQILIIVLVSQTQAPETNLGVDELMSYSTKLCPKTIFMSLGADTFLCFMKLIFLG